MSDRSGSRGKGASNSGGNGNAPPRRRPSGGAGLSLAVETALSAPKPMSPKVATGGNVRTTPSRQLIAGGSSVQAEQQEGLNPGAAPSGSAVLELQHHEADTEETGGDPGQPHQHGPGKGVASDEECRCVRLCTLPQRVERTWMQRLLAQCSCHTACSSPPACRGGGKRPDIPAESNEISTSKYTVLTFLPVNLFQQFCRVANLYFLITAALQLIPGLSPTSWFTTVFPLVVVLTINAIKEGWDDYQRHKSDAEINSRTVLVLSQGGKETPTAWRDVRVGDIVKVLQDQEVPADLLFMSSSDEGNMGHVETANLDGETNLKLKYCFGPTAGRHTADEFTDFEARCEVRCELPNPRLYVFDGAVVDRMDPNTPQEPLTADNLLLRGCTLRKTTWVIGLVVFMGADTKIMMNRTVSPRKVTQLERHMNVLVAIMFGVLIFFASMLAAGDQIFNRVNTGLWYLKYEDKWPDLGQGFAGWIVQVIRFIILMNGFIPISLYVTLEMVKVLQCFLILNSDRQMYHADSDTPFVCRTTTLNEDLGQVQYVLSDKTGTLTQNVMGFVWASIGGVMYGRSVTDQQQRSAQAAGSNGGSMPLPVAASLPQAPPPHIPAKTPHSITLDTEMHAKLGTPFRALTLAGMNGAKFGSASAALPSVPGPYREPDQAAQRFWINMAVCNTVVPQILEDGRFVYQASSPDEEALVQGAAYLGYRLISRSTDRVEVAYHGQLWSYEVLAVLEFNSDRKRMSIICRCPDGKIRLFCKGADTMIMARIQGSSPLSGTVRRHLEEMAQAGYRTLCVAEKEIPEVSWRAWHKQWHTASVALEGREDKIAAAAERIEVEMELLGATAVEDKLQEGVPEAIESLISAGIKVWVLTGDKVETAISIALACRLFCEDMALVEVRERDFEGVHGREAEAEVLKNKLDEVEMENQRMEFEAAQRQQIAAGGSGKGVRLQHSGGSGGGDKATNVGLVIEGGALAVALRPENQDALIALCSACKSVVCCRVSPMQKAYMTKLVQVKKQAVTLGIGDGANDVGMIQAAHIGCGISGREGRAAVLAADFSFAQFRYVARLLLLHGRAAYKRNTEVVLYSFYKNWVHNLTYLFFAFVTAFSSQPLYTSGLIATLNLFWASLPIIAFAFLEQDVSHATVKANPWLYQETMRGNRKQFLSSQLGWLLIATYHSLVVYFLPMYVMAVPDRNGLPDDWVAIGCTVYTATVVLVNAKMATRTRYWTWINHVLIWLSMALWFPFVWLYGLVWQVAEVDGTADMSDMANRLFASPRFWLAGVLLAPGLSLLLDLAIDSFKVTFAPKPYQILQEVEFEQDAKAAAIRELGLSGQRGPARAASGGDLEMPEPTPAGATADVSA